MKQVIVALCLLAGATAVAAPAPFARKEKLVVHPPWPTPGKYIVSWGGSVDKEGELLSYQMGWYYHHGTKYWFIYEWDGADRRFTMWESCGSEAENKMLRLAKDEMSRYTFYLNDELKTVGADLHRSNCHLHLKRK